MLIVFKSKAAAEIYMYAEHAKMLLDIIGKPLIAPTSPPNAPRGIITADQVPEALAKLKAAVETSKSAGKNEQSGDDPATPVTVGLAQRAFPLIDMLERAQTSGRDITWGD